MVNIELLPFAKAVGAYMAQNYIEKGDYYPEEAWGCEGQIYPSLMGIALLELYKTDGEKIFLDGLKAIIESNAKKQLRSGGWPLSLGATGNGLRFFVTPHLIEVTAKSEDLPPTVTALRLMGEYKLLTGDTSYDTSLEKGYHFLMEYWNADKKTFEDMLSGEALELRANPTNYQIYAYQCVLTLSQLFPEVKPLVEPLYVSVKQIFEAMDAKTYPLLYGLYAGVISNREGSSEYVKTEVRRRISEDITFSSPFLIETIPGAIGHRDGLRGMVLDEGHLRNSIGAALAMKLFDKAINEKYFTPTPFYKNLTNWIQSMFDGRSRYFEFIDVNNGERRGLGTPGQFLPLWWILGCL
jgi:hypothetical protein